MAKRKTISKKVRFEIFKRDEFKCQYCGNTPPSVILEIDHIIPVSKNGDNSDENLITACFDCNRGKRDEDLTAIPETLQEKINKEKKRREQVELYNEYLTLIKENEDNDIRELGLYWFNNFEEEKDTYYFGSARIPSIRRFLKELPKMKIIEAMDLAFSKNIWTEERSFKYMCAVCWNWIKGEFK